jgi:glyoxylate reductase
VNERPVAVICRALHPVGLELLEERFEVRQGGLDVTREELLELVAGAAAVIPDSSVTVDPELLDAAGDGLRVVSNLAVGYDNVDLDACRQRGVAVTNTPGVLTEATAELALALTLTAGRQLGDAERDLREGRWRGWDPGAYLGIELKEAVVGVVGLGRIGYRYAEMVRALGAQVVYAARSDHPDAESELGAKRLELDALCDAATVVSLHAPGGPETKGLIGARQLELIGPDGVLVNTARGSLVDAAALAASLTEGRLGAAGLDVYENEPEVPAVLLEAPRCVLLPHIGSASVRSRQGMARLAAENAIAVIEGREPESRVV